MIIIGCVGSRVGNRVRSICLFGCVHTPPRRRNYKKNDGCEISEGFGFCRWNVRLWRLGIWMTRRKTKGSLTIEIHPNISLTKSLQVGGVS